MSVGSPASSMVACATCKPPLRALIRTASLNIVSVVMASRCVRQSPLLWRPTWPSQSAQVRQILAELLPSISVDIVSGLCLRGELVEIAEDDPDCVIESQPDAAAQIHGPDSSERAVGETCP
jgi:hypothetical protein